VATATNGSTNLRERIKFELNRPIEVTIEGEGVEQAGTYGIEYRYMLADRKIMWVQPDAHYAIDRIHQSGTTWPFTVEICHRKDGRKAATWEVVHLEDEPQQPAARPRPASQQPAARPEPTPAMPAASRALPLSNGPANGDPPAASQPDPRVATEVGNVDLYTCMCAAIRVAAAAEKFAAQIGRSLAFETADIRAMAASLYIENRGARR
jgi:hypothetical protein